MKKFLAALLVVAGLSVLIVPTVLNRTNSPSIRDSSAGSHSGSSIGELATRPTSPTMQTHPTETQPPETQAPTTQPTETQPPQTQPPETEPETPQPVTFSRYGSAGDIRDTTIVISLLVNDQTTRWEEWDDHLDTMRISLNTAAKWITDKCGDYGVNARILTDWIEYPDLLYIADMDLDLVRTDGSMYWKQRDYLIENIPVEFLMDKYDAKNVIFMFLFNTDLTCEVSSRSITNTRYEYVDYEFTNLYTRNNNHVTPPATFAHEMLHSFGAYDLYYASEGIPQEYVDHCVEVKSRDVMYTVNLGEEITVEFTELCAYYIGLTDYCSVVSDWGLTLSTYDLR